MKCLKGNRTVLALCLQTQKAYTNESTGSEYANSKHEKMSDPNAVTAQSLGKSDVTIHNEHYMQYVVRFGTSSLSNL